MDRCGGSDRLAERADKHSASEGCETGGGTHGGEFEARGGVWGGEGRGCKSGERQPGQRRPLFSRQGDREVEQQVAARAAGFREYAGGARRGGRIQGNRGGGCQRLKHFAL